MLSDFEPPATSQPTERDAATARELRTSVKLLTLSTVDMATSPFAQHKTLRLLTEERTTDTGQSSITYSILLADSMKISDDKKPL